VSGEAMREAVRARILGLGFDVVRFAEAPDGAIGAGLGRWLKEGCHADMAWMERTQGKREDADRVLGGVRSLIVTGVNYWPGAEDTAAGGRPRWARYAAYSDYHDTMTPALRAAGRVLEEVAGLRPEDHREYVDTGPVLARGGAAQAGVGFTGKNAMLISREFGNWLLLGAILARASFPPDPPLRSRPWGHGAGAVGSLCGRCTRCLEACPTQAFPEPGVVDARRCIAYHTIENRGVIPRELREGIGDRIFGCDICLEVCPWNRFARRSREVLLAARPAMRTLSLREVLELNPERFAELFRGTAVKRLKRSGLLRNACVVAGNAGDRGLVPVLVDLARREGPLVRAHAVWALRRLGAGEEAEVAALRESETDPLVLAEFVGKVDPS
jgi:epoxyqueuosine reductase